MRLSSFHRMWLAWRALPYVGATRNSYLVQQGWFQSFNRRQSIDAAGKPIPWYTYPAIEFIGARLRREMNVFEYGSGNSTDWYAERVANVVACEHDREWAALVRKKLPPNATLVESELGEGYVNEISRHNRKFDVVAIDGRMRNECARHSVEFLSAGGIIIWDNAERPEYVPGLRFLADRGFRQIDFSGLGPIHLAISRTSILYRDDNVFQI